MRDDSKWNPLIKLFDEHLLATFALVRSLTVAMNQALEDDIEINPLIFEAATTSIRSRLLASSVSTGEPEQKIMNELCCLGIQIYQVSITDHLPLRLDIDRLDLLSRLRNRLRDAGPELILYPYLYLWLVFIGGIVAPNNDDRSWFAARLNQVAEGLALCDWHPLKSTLESFLWVGKLHDEPGRLLWNDTVGNN
jgi:hypothetical protein